LSSSVLYTLLCILLQLHYLHHCYYTTTILYYNIVLIQLNHYHSCVAKTTRVLYIRVEKCFYINFWGFLQMKNITFSRNGPGATSCFLYKSSIRRLVSPPPCCQITFLYLGFKRFFTLLKTYLSSATHTDGIICYKINVYIANGFLNFMTS